MLSLSILFQVGATEAWNFLLRLSDSFLVCVCFFCGKATGTPLEAGTCPQEDRRADCRDLMPQGHQMRQRSHKRRWLLMQRRFGFSLSSQALFFLCLFFLYDWAR